MTAEEAIRQALESVGVPFARLVYHGKASAFITYQLVLSSERDFSDDENAAEQFTYRIDLFSRADYINRLRSVKRALKAAGFFGIEAAAEIFERDTRFFHVPITAKYLERTEAAEP